MSSEGTTTLQKSLFLYTFCGIQVCFLLRRNKDNSDNKNHCEFWTLLLLIMRLNATVTENSKQCSFLMIGFIVAFSILSSQESLYMFHHDWDLFYDI